MRRGTVYTRASIVAVVIATAVSALGVAAAVPATAANTFTHTARGGISTPTGKGFWLVFANGAVDHFGDAAFYGDAHELNLQGPLQGGSGVNTGGGYWLVASDGGIFSYGSAHFYGSMGGTRLNQPVFSMASTRSGKGYWLVARDGGVFSFGDAEFFGSTGGIQLRKPIVGLVRHPLTKGYMMVASDGGVFNFGANAYHGSLPERGLAVSDVVGMASNASGGGYWIARRGGQVYAFGNAVNLRPYTAPGCDPVVGIIGNPVTLGYRLILSSGATIARGAGVDGKVSTGTPFTCRR